MCTTCGCGDESGHVLVPESRDGARDLGRASAPGPTSAPARIRDHDRASAPRSALGPGWVREVRTVRLERELLAKNNRIAARTRRQLADVGVAMWNLIGAPGAGKTSLLEATARRLQAAGVPLAVLEGDQATDLDAKRIARAGGRVLQINTGAGCHLDAAMVAEGVSATAPARGSVVFVENVGNLVCPALYDLGELAKVVVMSVAEGDDKPLKYAHVFRAADLFVLTKTDLLPHVPFDEAACVANARKVNPRLRVLPVSVTSGDGLDEWCAYVERAASRARP
ncbi:MAG: hydrogenase nickel incorporation protein HypB [Labilithrix sp.]|nr:hydrogenase nickel incorporation protein HypB [Labilithrix sp.]